MQCPFCSKTILDNSTSCPYCGQLVRRVVKDEPTNLPSQVQSVAVPANAVKKAESTQLSGSDQANKEIKKRHWQRWFFYGLLILLFLGAIGVIVKIYNENSKLLVTLSETSINLEKNKKDLTTTKLSLTEKENKLKEVIVNLSEKERILQESNKNLEQAQQELTSKTEEFQKILDEQKTNVEVLKQCKLDLTTTEANIYSLIIKFGVGVSNKDLLRIPLADANLDGKDTDGDGLSDEVEEALGTDKMKKDTNGNGYNDKQEILGGYDPINKGKLPIDQVFASKQKGKILLQVEAHNEAWYINPKDSKRYFLGKPADGYRAMKTINFSSKK